MILSDQMIPNWCGYLVFNTKNLIKYNSFLMLLPDYLTIKINCAKDIILTHNKKKRSVRASMKVQKKTVNTWGTYSKTNNINSVERNSLINSISFNSLLIIT